MNRNTLRSASIVAAATLALGASTALAANLQKVQPSTSPHGAASPRPSDTPSAKPSDPPEVKPSATSPTTPSQPVPTAPAPKDSQSASGDTHGDCVSKVANDPNARAANKHGKMTHGAAVSKAAHACPKGKDDNQQGGDTQDAEKPGAAEKPDASETPDPAETPDPKDSESPNAGD